MESLGTAFAAVENNILVSFVICIVATPLGELWVDGVKEFLGMAVMIVFTVAPGSWVGTDVWWQEWIWHFLGTVLADFVAGGPHVNPSVSIGMYLSGTLAYPKLLCRIAHQVAAGLVTFPLCRMLATALDLPQLKGPKFDNSPLAEAGLHEALSTFALLLAIFIFGWDLPTRRYYWINMSMVAVWIRGCLWFFPAAGPAMNPALATGYAASRALEKGILAFPEGAEHYLVYWAASVVGAAAAVMAYSFIGRGPEAGKKKVGKKKKES